MRKYLIGFIAGVLVATAGVAAADTVSLVGKKIQSEAVVTLDGEEIGTAIITDGTSFAPIRIVAEATGLKVGYEKGNVKLETQEKEMPLAYWEDRLTSLNEFLESTEKLVASTESKIQKAEQRLVEWNEVLNNLPDDASDRTKTEYEARITSGEKELEDFAAELKARKDRVAEIEQEIIYVKVQIAAAK